MASSLLHVFGGHTGRRDWKPALARVFALLSSCVSGGGEGSHFGGPVGTTPPMLGGGERRPAAVETGFKEKMLTDRQQEKELVREKRAWGRLTAAPPKAEKRGIRHASGSMDLRGTARRRGLGMLPCSRAPSARALPDYNPGSGEHRGGHRIPAGPAVVRPPSRWWGEG